jgi:hypothetical protein
MSIDTKFRKGQTSGSGKKTAAPPPQHGGERSPVLFHPLCAPRLETAIEQSRQDLVAASQAAASAIEKTLAFLVERPALLAADQRGMLTNALNRSLRALQAIDRLGAGDDPLSAANQRILDRSVRLLLEATNRIAAAQ